MVVNVFSSGKDNAVFSSIKCGNAFLQKFSCRPITLSSEIQTAFLLDFSNFLRRSNNYTNKYIVVRGSIDAWLKLGRSAYNGVRVRVLHNGIIQCKRPINNQ
ncbi:MAG: hypothetical protein ACOYI4_05520 [Christensenellales bacterium]|jgi:hypothetical protein